MKCIHCSKDCKYKERADRKCPHCRHAFAFEPRAGDLMSDGAFQRAIDSVSSGGHVRWGVEHLYYEICRRKRWPKLFIYIRRLFRAGPTLARVNTFRFNKDWDRWVKTHGTPKGLIVRQPAQPQPRELELDIGDYSFDRAVICDRARTVDVLLANNFHFENNCAVLSIEGYPPGPFDTVRTMLKRNPRLQVFALHDATPAGCRLAYQLAHDSNWFAGQAKVIDVGLRPEHAGPFEGLLIRSRQPHVKPGEGIRLAEAQWLSSYALELAAIRPEQVLKRLFRAITRQHDADATTDDEAMDVWVATGGDSGGSGSSVLIDSDSFGCDAAAADGGGDSFG